MQTYSFSVQIVERKCVSKVYICVKLTLPEVLCYNKKKKRRPLQRCQAAFELLSEVFFDMSSYIDATHPERHAPYLDIPDDVVEYLHYLDFVKFRSPRTINGYYLDLRGFFRFMMVQWHRADPNEPPQKIDLTHITTQDIAGVTKRDVFAYLDYTRNANNGAKARARKLSALKGFFGYLCAQVNKIAQNPTENISLGSPKKALPKYLTETESLELLNNIQSDFYERDFCMITLFLNCGMRLAELIGINTGDFRDDTIQITGKGGKERLVYLNDACKQSLQHYCKARAGLPNLVDKEALFVSKRTGKRLTARRVEQIVARCLQSAGLSGRGFSPHKLRHTAATLMYQGGVDMLALKEILGHENVSTTQIYTHINQQRLRQAVEASPLARQGYIEQKSLTQEDAEKEEEPATAQETQQTGKQQTE